jgi:hypothetical protein
MKEVGMPGYRLCMACGERRPLFAYRGVIKADRHHNLCFECYRAEGNRLRAWQPCEGAGAAGPPVHRPAPARSVADRSALLREIAVRRRHALIRARRALEAPLPVTDLQALAS